MTDLGATAGAAIEEAGPTLETLYETGVRARGGSMCIDVAASPLSPIALQLALAWLRHVREAVGAASFVVRVGIAVAARDVLGGRRGARARRRRRSDAPTFAQARVDPSRVAGCAARGCVGSKPRLGAIERRAKLQDLAAKRREIALDCVLLDAEGGIFGRPTGVTDRGQRSVVAYNDRGGVVWTARQMAVLSEAGTEPEDPFASPDESITTTSIVYEDEHTYARLTTFDHAGRALSLRLPRSADNHDEVSGAITYNQRGLPQTLSMADGTIGLDVVSAVDYAADGATTRVTYGQSDVWDDRDPVVAETEYDIRRRPVGVRVTRQPELDSNPQTLAAITRVVDQQYVWDDASNLTAVVDDRDPGEWPAGFRPQTTTIQHDSLYRVVGASFDYTQEDGSRTPGDLATNYRDTLADIESHDPMRTRPAPMVAAEVPSRVTNLNWQYDWLANMTSWTDDTESFHERSLGAITNGAELGEQEEPDEPPPERPSALRLATNLPVSETGSGGWTLVEYGESGNVSSVLVHGQCEDVSAGSCAADPNDTVGARVADLTAGCNCAVRQYYQYRWDELNRLVEARRYEAEPEAEKWDLHVRQRYRYDAANQRTLKSTNASYSSNPKGPYTLYVYPGDFERRGLILTGSPATYEPDATLGTEDQYVVAGARYVRRDVTSTSTGGLDRTERITIGLSDLIGTTAATLNLLSGEITETSTYYPNGATETYRALQESDGDSIAREPVGFTGKEADEEVGLVYFGERYLISRLGRWATPDPLHVHAVGGGEALNSYHYVGGNLLQESDPLGLEFRPAGRPMSRAQRLASRTYRHDPIGEWRRRVQGREEARRVWRSLEAERYLNWERDDCPGLAAPLPGGLPSESELSVARRNQLRFVRGDWGPLEGGRWISMATPNLGRDIIAIREYAAEIERLHSGAQRRDIALALLGLVLAVGTATLESSQPPRDRTVALDANAVRGLTALRESGVVRATDRLVVTPNVATELDRHGISGTDVRAMGIEVFDQSPIGASVVAAALARTLRVHYGDQPSRGVPSASADALNIAEAAGVGADVFVTNDRHVRSF